jgi:hypothetical protein
MEDLVQWTTPAPMWPTFGDASGPAPLGAARQAMQQPAILRFATDTFMEEFTALMESEPWRLGEFVARPETWRGPTPPPAPGENVPRFILKHPRFGKLLSSRAGRAPLPVAQTGGVTSDATNSGPADLLKLYQPAHQRYYLIAGCLVCRRPGLPDKALQTNREERATFVVRRLLPKDTGGSAQAGAPLNPADFDEYAFVGAPGKGGWQKIAGSPEVLLKDEEQLPLFPLNYTEGDSRQRRLFAGLIPVAKREAYMGAAPAATPSASGQGAAAKGELPKTARKILFRTQVAEPWKRIVETAFTAGKSFQESGSDKPTPGQRKNQLKEAREKTQISSWYVLLDFAKYLKQYVRSVWDAIERQSSAGLTQTAERNLYDALSNVRVADDLRAALVLNDLPPAPAYTDADIPLSLREALRLIGSSESKLDEVTTPYDREDATKAAAWPPFIFPLADPVLFSSAPRLANGTSPLTTADFVEQEETIAENNDPPKQALLDGVDKMTALVVRAMPKEADAPAPPPPLAAQMPLDPTMREGLFALRCVYERPLCGPIDPPQVSKPTAPFQMAGFFDPDAPARPIRIALPLDTSPAGLRKFDKNTAFMISDVLCGQIQRLKSLTFGDLVLSVLPWPFHKDLSAAAPDAGACKSGGGMEIGMICSLSLPIITICALLLLIIIVFLLDIVFKWIPYFFICFPVPGLKGKKGG